MTHTFIHTTSWSKQARVWCLSYPLHGGFGKPSPRQSGPQFTDVDASIFVEVQLIKQLTPALLSLLIWTGGSDVLAECSGKPSPLWGHSWSQLAYWEVQETTETPEPDPEHSLHLSGPQTFTGTSFSWLFIINITKLIPLVMYIYWDPRLQTSRGREESLGSLKGEEVRKKTFLPNKVRPPKSMVFSWTAGRLFNWP